MQSSDYAVVMVTAGTIEEAQKISRLLLEEKTAACVNIVPKISSSYWWEGKIETAEEYLLIIKTKTAMLPELIELVKGAHSYSVPEIVALPIVGGNPEYLDWIGESLD